MCGSVFISETELKWQMVAVPVAIIESRMILLWYCSELSQNNADLGVCLSGSFLTFHAEVAKIE